jgi:hypothetical protein
MRNPYRADEGGDSSLLVLLEMTKSLLPIIFRRLSSNPNGTVTLIRT